MNKKTSDRKHGSRSGKPGRSVPGRARRGPDSIKKETIRTAVKPERLHWRSGNMLYPVPAVMVTCTDQSGAANIITIAWTGTVCSDPAMVYISVRPERHSYQMIKAAGEFVINLTSEALAGAADFCGVRSGRDCDKFRECNLTPLPSVYVAAPSIAESPVNIECRVKQVIPLGTHDMFLAEVLGVSVDARLIDQAGRLCLERANPVAYSHGEYFALGKFIGKFGFSVSRRKTRKQKRR